MANIKVKDLTDTQTINTDNEIMVLTNENTNLVQNITVENFITNVISSDSDNVIEQGTDGKLFVETPENITGDLSDLTTTNKSTLVGAINEVDGDITSEATTRQIADNNLQSQIDAITAASDVTDIVGTYAELQAYDTTGLPDNSIIKVLQDESRQDETTYYRWVITGGVGAWVLIGEEGPYYTISQSDSKFATQETVGNLNNLTTSDKSSVVNAMNELASVLDPTQTVDYIKNSKAIYSGEVSQNALILPQIKEMAHSTFDASKFTVEGSPIITDDGIASGFSTSNYLRISTSALTSVTEFTEEIEFTTDSNVTTRQEILNGAEYNGTPPITLRLNTDSKFYIDVRYADNSSFAYWISPVVVTANTTYKIKFEAKNGVFCWYVNGEEINHKTIDNPCLFFSGSLRLGSRDDYVFLGSIDLKQFSITVDGVPVFSGNKTGIDTIKPDDYTVVGTPTISADGIASGFSSSNYLFTTIAQATSSCIVKQKVKIPENLASGSHQVMYSFGDGWSTTALRINADGSILLNLIFTDNTYSYDNVVATLDASLLGEEVVFETEFTNNKVYVRGYDNNKNIIFPEYSKNVSLMVRTADLYIGCEPIIGSSDYYWQGSIDLNAFKIYVDGDLVYQPCLKIPYTESKTGSKIVDAIYRDRINDMAEQFGFANYYTLSDTDFTLPQVELYGLIDRKLDVKAPTTEEVNTVISWRNVDYANAISITEATLEGDGYTAPDDGLFMGLMLPAASNATITVNNISLGTNWYQTTASTYLMSIPLSKGDILKITNIAHFSSANFIPFKGEN